MRGKIYKVSTIGFLFLIGFILGLLYSPIISTLPPRLHTQVSTNQKFRYHDENGERIIADVLFNEIRVVCMILTTPKNHATKARHVKDTWGKGCNKYFFVSSVKDDSLPSVAAVSREGRDVLWNKTRFAVRHAAKVFGNDYDYFLKADDDTYVIMENLRKLLLGYNSDVPFILGRRFRPYVEQGYLSGGGGYVLSRSGLHRLVHSLDNDDPGCLGRGIGFAEDVEMGKCAQVANVTLLDSLDEYGLERFHPFGPKYMMDSDVMKATTWILTYNYHKLSYGMNCCSDYSVSFHYISPESMQVMDFLINHVRPYGVYRDYNDLGLLAEILHLGDRRDSKQWVGKIYPVEITEQQKRSIFNSLRRRYLSPLLLGKS